MPIRNRLAEMAPEIAGWRHHLHTIPELEYDLPKTTAYVLEKLEEFGIEDVTAGVGQSGIVATIKGKSDTKGRVIGLRADMDALPMDEVGGVDYASTHPGMAHTCGHDGHTSMLLGAAKYLNETRNFDGTVVLIFQPAEEEGAGGKAMVDDGMMDRWGVQEVYGMHNMPGLPVGQFAVRPGALMASVDTFDVTVTGKGGHAAVPHDAIDTNLVAAQMVVALNSITSRNVDPLKSAVVTVTTMLSDTDSYNVIPQTVNLKGTVRTLDNPIRDLIEERVTAILEATAVGYGATVDIAYNRGYPVTVNHDDQTAYAAEAARAVVGDAGVDTDTPPIMPAEDFAYMLEARPGAYLFLGNGDTPMCHHPAYVFTDDILPVGSSWFAEIVERRMPAA
ncbi:M20 aminoacylase family protein [Chachezhania antarctica]|uniref:M20 aminoacylase family protein n=1 Tax=Chachezhania antarctica TaxID=2340860 RepID=UPI000EABBC62|nr:M20 aminoacylase family protein [Chachezhania antarctica]|tara:strand:- start:2403 stop:3575 length:1173 start_codon:yes stop_codon:yes gene_type:complete